MMTRIVILFFLLSNFANAQRDFGLAITKELCSEKYHGRGYVFDGHKMAADFVAQKFKEFGVQPLQESGYFQHFNIDVNTFPAENKLIINGKTLAPGIDYILDANSGTNFGKYTPVYIRNKNDLFKFEYGKESRENKIIVIVDPASKNIDTNALFREMKYRCADLAPVLWITDAKFTWTVGHSEYNFPIFHVKHEFADSISGKILVMVKNIFVKGLKTQNVLGKIEGKCKRKTVVISAHYDHLGVMGAATYFPGANDNASGVAMLLYLAKYYSENKPPFNIVFMAFGAEEVGIVGSKYYVNHPIFPLEDIRFLINLDILGTGEEGITVVNGAVFKKEFKKLSELNQKESYLKKVKVRGKAANSDHYFFSEAGVPSIFIYTMGGVSYYHDVFDKAETLPLNEFDDLAKLLIGFIKKL